MTSVLHSCLLLLTNFDKQTFQILQVVILEDKRCHILEGCYSALRRGHRDTFYLVVS